MGAVCVASCAVALASPAAEPGPAPIAASRGDGAAFELVGRYTHDFTEPADAPVWRVQRTADGYRLDTLADAESARAWQLDAAGRAAFWAPMHWAVPTSQAAACLSWGEPPAGLHDLLQGFADAPPAPGASHAAPVAATGAAGAGVLCRVPVAQRQAIDRLGDPTSEYFLFDPMGGVVQVRRLP